MTNQGKNGIDVILAESLKELSKTRPIEKITIKEITDKAGVIRPTFYNHFQDKYELLEWIVREDLMEPAKPLFDNGLLREGITFLFTAMEKEREFYEKAIRLEGQNSFVEMMENVVQELILQRMNKEKLSEKITYTWLSLDMIAQYYAHMACSVATKWINGGMQVPIPELVEVYVIMAQKSMIEIIS